jgi:aldose 1-epimerase
MRLRFILAPIYLFVTISLVLPSCRGGEPTPDAAETEVVKPTTISSKSFGTTPQGIAELYTLRNTNGMEVQLTNYGGIITSILAPDRNGNLGDVALGFDSIAPYTRVHPYFGALIGRFGNRIAKGEFTINGKSYELPTNNGPNSLHGGAEGFDKKMWTATTFSREDTAGVVLSYLSPDGEEGYPGNLAVSVTYTLNAANEIGINYQATTDAPTPINLTNHTYFNLTGGGGDVLAHEMKLKASQFTPVDKTLIPTGELQPVAGTPFDFTTPKTMGRDINAENEQLQSGGGYDHNFVLDRIGSGLENIATVFDPTSGRILEVLTTEPGIQFYSGNFLNGTLTGKGGTVYTHRSGFCLETQHYPDSPNQPDFPSTILEVGDTYQSETVYRFSTR